MPNHLLSVISRNTDVVIKAYPVIIPGMFMYAMLNIVITAPAIKLAILNPPKAFANLLMLGHPLAC